MAAAILKMPPPRVTIPPGDRHKHRRCIEIAVEKLIAYLDTLDGDPDLEDEVWELDADFEPAVA